MKYQKISPSFWWSFNESQVFWIKCWRKVKFKDELCVIVRQQSCPVCRFALSF